MTELLWLLSPVEMEPLFDCELLDEADDGGADGHEQPWLVGIGLARAEVATSATVASNVAENFIVEGGGRRRKSVGVVGKKLVANQVLLGVS